MLIAGMLPTVFSFLQFSKSGTTTATERRAGAGERGTVLTKAPGSSIS